MDCHAFLIKQALGKEAAGLMRLVRRYRANPEMNEQLMQRLLYGPLTTRRPGAVARRQMQWAEGIGEALPSYPKLKGSLRAMPRMRRSITEGGARTAEDVNKQLLVELYRRWARGRTPPGL
jgi:hypothetical protein